MMIPINAWSGDQTAKDDSPVGFIFKVGAGYRHELNELIGISAGVGINGFVQSDDTSIYDSSSGMNFAADMTLFSLNMYGRLAVDFTVIGCLGIDVGIMLGGPVYSSADVSASGVSVSADIDIGGFYAAPYVGVSYLY